METVIISVCISAYNGEVYLKRCLDSVISQDVASMEIILVDDGSTDGTLSIMHDYQERYPEIRIIRQKHSGLAQGRKTGVKNSTGEYVTFLDADDYLIEGAYKTIIQFMDNNKADIYEFQTEREGYLSKSPYTGIMNASRVLKDYFDGVGIPVNYWLRWYKRGLFSDQMFPVGISLYEDLYAFPCILSNADRIAYIEKPLHTHTKESKSSIMNSLYEDRNGKEYYERQKALLLSIPHIESNIGADKLVAEYKEAFEHYKTNLFRSFVFIDVKGVSYREKLEAIISTLGLKMTPRELEKYIEQNINLNRKKNYAIRYIGLHNTYLLNTLVNRIRATT